MYSHKIKNEDGDWIPGDDSIGEAACEFFEDLITETGGSIREDLLKCIPFMITSEDNEDITRDPIKQEIRMIVFFTNPDSAAGLDEMNGIFFQPCRDYYFSNHAGK